MSALRQAQGSERSRTEGLVDTFFYSLRQAVPAGDMLDLLLLLLQHK